MAERLSNRDHHLSFFKPNYEGKAHELALLVIRAENLMRDLHDLSRKCKNIDANRRENAVRMGVRISESDEVYSFDNVYRQVPDMVGIIKAQFAQMGIDIKELK